jgi:hypothetical protein
MADKTVDPKDVTPGYWWVRWPGGREEVVRVTAWDGDATGYDTFGNDNMPTPVVYEACPTDPEDGFYRDRHAEAAPAWLRKVGPDV